MTLPTHTPAKNSFTLPTPALEKAIAAEWEGAEKYNAARMPLTALAFTAIDRIAEKKDDVVEVLMVYVDTDTLSYRASSSEALKKQQDEEWGAILAWANARFDVSWQTTSGVMPVEQPEALHRAIHNYLQSLDAWKLSAFCIFASLCSSLVLAVAVTENHIDAEKAFALSRLEEEAQAAQWGRDLEAETRAKKMQEEILQAEQFLRLL